MFDLYMCTIFFENHTKAILLDFWVQTFRLFRSSFPNGLCMQYAANRQTNYQLGGLIHTINTQKQQHRYG